MFILKIMHCTVGVVWCGWVCVDNLRWGGCHRGSTSLISIIFFKPPTSLMKLSPPWSYQALYGHCSLIAGGLGRCKAPPVDTGQILGRGSVGEPPKAHRFLQFQYTWNKFFIKHLWIVLLIKLALDALVLYSYLQPTQCQSEISPRFGIDYYITEIYKRTLFISQC